MGHEDSAWVVSSCPCRKVALPQHPNVTVSAKQPLPLVSSELEGARQGHGWTVTVCWGRPCTYCQSTSVMVFWTPRGIV